MIPETDIFEVIKYYIFRAKRAKSPKVVIPEKIFNNATTGPRLHIKDNIAKWVKDEGGTLITAFEGLSNSDLTINIKWD